MAKFGIQIEPQFGFDYSTLKDLALECESVGFNSMWLSDHLFLDARSQERNCLDCWTTLAALAAETTSLRLGSLVSCVSYRYPSILAKMAATVDVISDGRLEFGIGAGWKELEYQAYGIPFPPVGERISRFIEAIQLIQNMWTQARPSFNGRYYEIEEAFSAPKPIQKPYPPFWIGGTGSRVLRATALFADGLNVNGSPTTQEYQQRLDILRHHCLKVNRQPESIRLSHFIQIITASDRSSLEQLVKTEARRTGLHPEEFRTRTRAFVGTPEECAQYLQSFIDLGVSQFMLLFPYRHESESLRLVAEQVLTKL